MLYPVPYATGAWQTYVLMLGVPSGCSKWFTCRCASSTGAPWCARFRQRKSGHGDVPRHRLELEAADGIVVCEAGQPLSKKQANHLRKLGNPGLPEKSSIEREQGFPFVPFIVAGSLLTTVFAGNLAPPGSTSAYG